MQCARHPKEETALSCSRCGTPICPRCSISGAVGMLCPLCAKPVNAILYRPTPFRFVLGLVVSVGAGLIVGLATWRLGYWFFVMFFLGGFLGQAVWQVVGRKNGLLVEWLTGVGIALGACLSVPLSGHLRYYLHDLSSAAFLFIAVALTIVGAISRLRQ